MSKIYGANDILIKILSQCLSFDPVSDYSWGGAWGNPYPDGDSSFNPDWDWCFRTYAKRSREFNNIFENHPFLFKLLQLLFQRLEL